MNCEDCHSKFLKNQTLDARVVRGQSEVERKLGLLALHRDEIGSYRNCLSRLAIVSYEDYRFKFKKNWT